MENITESHRNNQVGARRALEALRAGVPNSESVLTLGTTQKKVVDAFKENLEKASQMEYQIVPPEPIRGLLLGGGFGDGKSHLLEHLAQIALRQDFLVSKVVISKETPLHNIAAVYRDAINDARVPGRPGLAIQEIAMSLDTNSSRYAQFYRWLHEEGSFIDHRLTSSLRLFEQQSAGDEEFTNKIIQFWAGEPFPVTELRKRLREVGWLNEYSITASKEEVLCRDRLLFFSHLIRAAGYQGWVILIDEVELISRYSLLQRARSYVEVAGWLDGSSRDPSVPLVSVLTTVDDFESEVLIARKDAEKIPEKLASGANLERRQMVKNVKRGMQYLARNQIRLESPSNADLDQTYMAIKKIHADALAWQPPDVTGIERLPSNRIRQYVRSWINEWDLVYLDPDYKPETVVTPLEIEFGEDSEIEEKSESY